MKRKLLKTGSGNERGIGWEGMKEGRDWVGRRRDRKSSLQIWIRFLPLFNFCIGHCGTCCGKCTDADELEKS